MEALHNAIDYPCVLVVEAGDEGLAIPAITAVADGGTECVDGIKRVINAYNVGTSCGSLAAHRVDHALALGCITVVGFLVLVVDKLNPRPVGLIPG